MDKSAIEKFSINARIKLRNSVDSSMAKLGFGPGRDVESIQSIGDITVITLPGGIQTRITNDEAKYRERLAEVISKDGYDNVVEQIAYTWFNRLIAIRYMEVNDFLPTHVRVLSSNNPDKTEPDLVSQCLDHPRVRGEGYAFNNTTSTATGSPPRSRGRRPGLLLRQPVHGITPAFAGKAGPPSWP